MYVLGIMDISLELFRFPLTTDSPNASELKWEDMSCVTCFTAPVASAVIDFLKIILKSWGTAAVACLKGLEARHAWLAPRDTLLSCNSIWCVCASTKWLAAQTQNQPNVLLSCSSRQQFLTSCKSDKHPACSYFAIFIGCNFTFLL